MPDTPTPFYRLVRTISRGLTLLYGGVTITGMENIPATGPVILAPITAPMLIRRISPRFPPARFSSWAKKNYSHVPILKQIITGVGAFPVKRGAADRAALKHSVNLLKDNQIVLIFPEGTRSEDGSLRPAEKGFALIARLADAPIIPVAIEGTEKVLPKGATFLHRAPVRITIGPPLTVAAILAAHPDAGKDALDIIGAATMNAIAALLAPK